MPFRPRHGSLKHSGTWEDAVRLILDGFTVALRGFQGSLSQRAVVAKHENTRSADHRLSKFVIASPRSRRVGDNAPCAGFRARCPQRAVVTSHENDRGLSAISSAIA